MPEAPPPATFFAGITGLDFLNTVGTPVGEVVEWIGSGENFLSWLFQASLVSADDVSTVQTHISKKQLDSIAAEARVFREWFRGFVLAYKGKPLSTRALTQLEPLNKLLRLDEIFWTLIPNLEARGAQKKEAAAVSVFHMRPQRRWRTPESLLSPVAEEVAKVLSIADFTYIKMCEGQNCSLLFLDETRHHKRRWCSMALCGNRAKQIAHRQRMLKEKEKRVPRKAVPKRTKVR